MRGAAVKVHPWPLRDSLPLQDLGKEPFIIGVATADTAIRHDARARIRAALREALSLLHAVPAEAVEAVELTARPGHAPYAIVRGTRLHLSISHEPGCSIAAVSRRPVGVDLMRVSAMPDWEVVARDYLLPEAARRIRQLPPEQRQRAFALEWTALEASLKCLAMGLEERNEVRDARLRTCAPLPLDLEQCIEGGEAYVGSLASN